MRNLTNKVIRGLVALSIAGFGLAMTPAVAHADVFTVDEGNVPGANDLDRIVDGLTGKYQEELTQDAAASGNFSADLIVQFTSYTLGGSTVVDQIGAAVAGGEIIDTNLYSLYAVVTVSGTFTSIDLGGGLTQFIYSPTAAQADIYTDPSRDTTYNYTVPSVVDGNGDDQHIVSANGLLTFPDSNGFVTTDGTSVFGGSYALSFTNVTLQNPDGLLYWPTLVGFSLTGVASGDVDPNSECPDCVFPTDVRGDTSISFNVPEPATLSLLGIGLLGIGAAARRRRKA